MSVPVWRYPAASEDRTMQELLPLALGLVLGAALGIMRPGVRLIVGGGLAILLGVLVTVVTGEARLSWGYVLVDIPLVGGAAVVGLAFVRLTVGRQKLS